MPILLFLAVLEHMLEFLIPASVGWMALRRLLHCSGYDRLYYGYVVLYCIVAIWLLPPRGAHGLEAHIFRYMAFSTLPLWLLVLYETDGPMGGDRGPRPLWKRNVGRGCSSPISNIIPTTARLPAASACTKCPSIAYDWL